MFAGSWLSPAPLLCHESTAGRLLSSMISIMQLKFQRKSNLDEVLQICGSIGLESLCKFRLVYFDFNYASQISMKMKYG